MMRPSTWTSKECCRQFTDGPPIGTRCAHQYQHCFEGPPTQFFRTSIIHATSGNYYWLPSAYHTVLKQCGWSISRLRHKYEMTFIQSRNNRDSSSRQLYQLVDTERANRAIRQAFALLVVVVARGIPVKQFTDTPYRFTTSYNPTINTRVKAKA